MGRARPRAAPLDERAAALVAELDHERRERARDEASLGEMLARIAELERALREADARAEDVTRIAELESALREADARADALENERNVLAARLRDLTTAASAAREAHENGDAQLRVGVLEKELRAALDARSSAQRDAVELAAELDERGRAADASRARALELERRVSELEVQLAATPHPSRSRADVGPAMGGGAAAAARSRASAAEPSPRHDLTPIGELILEDLDLLDDDR